MLRRRHGLAAALLLVSLTAVACGGDDEGGSDESSAPTSGATTTTSTAAPAEPELDLPEPICSALTEDEMGGVLQAEVTVEVATDEECTFSVTGRDVTVRVLDAYDPSEGLGTLPDTLEAQYGPIEQVPELGAPAAVAIGEPKGGVLQAGGVIRRGDYYVTGVLISGDGITPDVARTGMASILELISQQ